MASPYLHFVGGAGNNFTVAGLSNTTAYDYTVTYSDDTTATGGETTDGSGNLVLGEAQVNFDGLRIKTVDITADGGGSTLVYIDCTALSTAELAAASFTDSVGGKTVTINGDEWTYGTELTSIAGATPELLLQANDGYTIAGDLPMWFDRSGNGHHGQWGSAAGADTNDPVRSGTSVTFTTNDYVEIADHANLDFAAGEAFTVIAVVKPTTVAAGSDVIVAKKDNLTTSAGWALVRNAATVQTILADGTADDDDTAGTLVANTVAVVAGVRNVTDDDIEAFVDGTGSGSPTTDSTTATLANALPLRIGATSNTAANFFEGDINAVALFRSALTDTQIAEIGTYLASTPDVADAATLHKDKLQEWILSYPHYVVQLENNYGVASNALSIELVGALNSLNNTEGKEYAEARGTFLGIPPAG